MKKKIGKYLAAVLSLTVLVSSMSVPAFAAETEPVVSEETSVVTEADGNEGGDLILEESESEFLSEIQEAEGNTGVAEDQVVLSGLPELTETFPDENVAATPAAQYLALGDSISAGYGLADKSDCFVTILSENSGYSVNNPAVNGLTSTALLAAVTSGQFDALLEGTKVITLTIGGNDMMAVLYQLVADVYNAAGSDSIAAADVPDILSNVADPRNIALTKSALKILLSGYNSVKPQFITVLNGVGENIKNITTYIKGKNSEIQILVANQYNPYKWMAPPYNAMGIFFDGGVKDLNAQISAAENGAGTTYKVVDAYTAFGASEENLCNASSNPINLDFHPNSKGHALLAALFTPEMPEKGLDAPKIAKTTISQGNRIKTLLAGKVDGADGYDFVIGKKADCIKTGSFVQTCKNQKDLQGDFFYIPKGTYYVYSRAYVKAKNGTKTYGDWSKVSKIKVTATTPAKPKILKVKVKGRNVTVTYTKCKNATGYDVVLGKSVKKVNGESRPVSYGKNIITAKKGSTVSVTFKNVKKGTYYAGLHSFNKTGAKGSRVFGKWSPTRKVVVK